MKLKISKFEQVSIQQDGDLVSNSYRSIIKV